MASKVVSEAEASLGAEVPVQRDRHIETELILVAEAERVPHQRVQR